MAPNVLRPGLASGFTLLELLVTVVVLAILVAAVLPTQTRMVARTELTAAANDLFAALQFARQESVRRNGHVQVCGSAGGHDCDGGGWHQWIVRSASGEVLRIGHMPPSIAVQPVGLFGTGMQFNATGMFHQRGGRSREGIMRLCSARAKRQLEVEALGGVQLRLGRAAAGECR